MSRTALLHKAANLHLIFALKMKRLDDQPSAGTEFTEVSVNVFGKNWSRTPAITWHMYINFKPPWFLKEIPKPDLQYFF